MRIYRDLDDNIGVICFKERSIVKVELFDGTFQPFYRSTGRNSNKPGEWLPFDGVTLGFSWFIKWRFGRYLYDDEGHKVMQKVVKDFGWGESEVDDVIRLPLHRYGTHYYKAISELLSLENIPEGKKVVHDGYVNDFCYGARNAPIQPRNPLGFTQELEKIFNVR